MWCCGELHRRCSLWILGFRYRPMLPSSLRDLFCGGRRDFSLLRRWICSRLNALWLGERRALSWRQRGYDRFGSRSAGRHRKCAKNRP